MTTRLFPESTAQSTTTTGTDTLTLGAALAGHQALTAAADTHLVDVRVDASDGAWETFRDATYTHSGTTLTRGTFTASSTGAVLSLVAGTHKVYITLSGYMAEQFALGIKPYAPGSFTIPQAHFVVHSKEMILTGTQEVYCQGNSELRII